MCAKARLRADMGVSECKSGSVGVSVCESIGEECEVSASIDYGCAHGNDRVVEVRVLPCIKRKLNG